MEKTALMTSLGPHVLRGLRVVQDAHFCYLVTELCRGGSLKSLLKSGPLSEDRSLQILEEIVRGELGLVNRGILHRDLKPANILMEDGHVKIIDFGYCQIEGHKKPSLDYNVGSPSYMAP
jgi:serine/threonine protein kinase